MTYGHEGGYAFNEDQRADANCGKPDLQSCDGCRYSSELLVREKYGDVEGMCLNSISPHYQAFEHIGCDLYQAGQAVDDPSRAAS